MSMLKFIASFNDLENESIVLIDKKSDDLYFIKINGREYEINACLAGSNKISILKKGKSYDVNVNMVKRSKNSISGEFFASVSGKYMRFSMIEDYVKKTKELSSSSALKKGGCCVSSPMSGKILKLLISEKEFAKKNQTLCIIEAMKMENEIKAPKDGVIDKIYIKSGDLVESGCDLLNIS